MSQQNINQLYNAHSQHQKANINSNKSSNNSNHPSLFSGAPDAPQHYKANNPSSQQQQHNRRLDSLMVPISKACPSLSNNSNKVDNNSRQRMSTAVADQHQQASGLANCNNNMSHQQRQHQHAYQHHGHGPSNRAVGKVGYQQAQAQVDTRAHHAAAVACAGMRVAKGFSSVSSLSLASSSSCITGVPPRPGGGSTSAANSGGGGSGGNGVVQMAKNYKVVSSGSDADADADVYDRTHRHGHRAAVGHPPVENRR